MSQSFQIVPLPPERVAALHAKTDDELRAVGARRMTVDANPGFPCRVSLTDAAVGETVVLLPFAHHDVDSPYRASGPIFVREEAAPAVPGVGEVPEMLRCRRLSLRAYDAGAMMVDAAVAGGEELEEVIARLFGDERVAYLHVHNAGPGCYNCSVVRA